MTSETKPYIKTVIIAVLIMTLLSVVVFILSTQVQSTKLQYSKNAEEYSDIHDTIANDIQSVLANDGAKYEAAYSLLLDLYALNDLYNAMEAYNSTHPGNYTQQDFDAVAMEFTAQLRQLIEAVEDTWLHAYLENELNVTVYNEYTYYGYKWFLIEDKWDDATDPIHTDIKIWVTTDFTLTSDPVQLPSIKFADWVNELNGNISILLFTGHQDGILSAVERSAQQFNPVNVSISEFSSIGRKYLELSEKAGVVIDNFNNTLITVATSALLIAFAISFDNKKNILFTLIIGLVVLALSFVYLGSSWDNFMDLSVTEASIFLFPTY